MKLTRLLLALTALVSLVISLPAADPVSDAELVKLINAFRKENNLPEIPVSPAMTKVAHTHLQDLIQNKPHEKSKNIFAWSNKGQWKPGNPGTDGKASWTIMWHKPKEIADYKGLGFELAYLGVNVSAKDAMKFWAKDKSGRDLLLNQGRFTKDWEGIGAAQGKGFFLVWFGKLD